jgi:hypothetical protein
MIESVLGASGADPRPKADVRSWKELREQLKDDIVNAHKKRAKLTTINQLLLLRNFSTLRIKGIGRMAASQEIAQQWHEGEGVHFARQVRILARHYQVYEQLPTQSVGGYRGYSVFNDKRVQNAARNWLSKLPTGEVSPRRFCRALTEEIIPCFGLNKDSVLERTVR